MKKVKIGISFVALIVVCIVFNKLSLLLNYFFALALHELAHLLVAIKRGYSLKVLKLYMFGLSMELDEKIDNSDSFAINLAGPIVNLGLAIICVALYWLIPSSYQILNTFCMSNLILAGFNLIPIYPLDGGKVIKGIVKNDKMYRKVDLIIRIVLASLFVLLFFITFKSVINWFFIIFAVFFVVSKPKISPTMSIFKFKSNKNIEKVVMLKVSDNESLFSLLKKIKKGQFTIFYLNNSKSRFIDEDEIVDLSLKYPLTSKLKEMFL